MYLDNTLIFRNNGYDVCQNIYSVKCHILISGDMKRNPSDEAPAVSFQSSLKGNNRGKQRHYTGKRLTFDTNLRKYFKIR